MKTGHGIINNVQNRPWQREFGISIVLRCCEKNENVVENMTCVDTERASFLHHMCLASLITFPDNWPLLSLAVMLRDTLAWQLLPTPRP